MEPNKTPVVFKRVKIDLSNDKIDNQVNSIMVADILSLTWKVIFEELVNLQVANMIDQEDTIKSCRMLLLLKQMTCKKYIVYLEHPIYLLDMIRDAMELIRLCLRGLLKQNFKFIEVTWEYTNLVKEKIYKEEQEKMAHYPVQIPKDEYEKLYKEREEDFRNRIKEFSKLIKEKKAKKTDIEIGQSTSEIEELDERLLALVKQPKDFKLVYDK